MMQAFLDRLRHLQIRTEGTPLDSASCQMSARADAYTDFTIDRI